MSLEPRLRDALRADAAAVQPDVEGNLDAVRRRATRRAAIHPVAFVALAAAVAVVLIVRAGGIAPFGVGPGSSPGTPSVVPSVGPSLVGSPAPAATYAEIAGTYTTTLAGSAPGVAANGLAGAWTLTLQLDGVLDLKPPVAFRAEGVAPTGNAFTQAGTQFRTNLFYNDFCSSIGTYAWARSAGRLTFTVVDDPCAIRAALLTTAAWQETGPVPTGRPPFPSAVAS